MSAPAVSVVIPTYKAAGFIAGTLMSVFAQTRPPAEVVVADDCSPDDTVEVVEHLAAAAPVPVRVVRLARNSGGPVRPLNAGIRAARGDLIATLDHDDEMEPDKLDRQVAVLAAAPGVQIVIHRVRPVGDLHGPLPRIAAGLVDPFLDAVPRVPLGGDGFCIRRADAYAGLLRVNYALTCSTMLFRKAAWHRVGGFDPRFRSCSDYAFFQAVVRRSDVGFVDHYLVRWLRHDANLTGDGGVMDPSRVETWAILNRFCPKLLDRHGIDTLADLRADQEDCLHGMAYRLRQAGRPAAALRVYAALFRRRPSVRYAVAAGKSAAMAVLARPTGLRVTASAPAGVE